MGEMFPNRTRAKQAALATASNWLWVRPASIFSYPQLVLIDAQNFLLAFFTPFIVSAIKFSYGFVFAGCNLAGAIIVWAFLYESSGLSLENVDIMYHDPAVKPWTSARWAPPGYDSRADAEAEKKHRGAPADGEKGIPGSAGTGTAIGAEEERVEHAKS